MNFMYREEVIVVPYGNALTKIFLFDAIQIINRHFSFESFGRGIESRLRPNICSLVLVAADGS